MIIGTLTPRDSLIPISFLKSFLSVRDYNYIIQEGPSIPLNRNQVFEQARIRKEDLLFIDSDMVFTPQNVKAIENHLKEKDIVTGVCVMSYEGHSASLFKNEDGKYKLVAPQKELFEVDACGAAFLGISKNVLDLLVEPFEPLLDKTTGHQHGEDISFCIRAKEAGFKIWCDPELKIGHIKSKVLYYEG